jgi:hypothetical protein
MRYLYLGPVCRLFFTLAILLTVGKVANATMETNAVNTAFAVKAADIDAQALVGINLIRYRASEVRQLSERQVKKLNKETLDYLENLEISRVVDGAEGRRLNGVSEHWAEKIMESIDEHPVVSSYQYSKYNREGVEIGFCFGRAVYAHLALLKMGVNKDAIKKIWAVGPMSNGVNWEFHVGTIVKDSRSDKWWVIDNFPGRLLDLEEWFDYFSRMSTDQKLRLYVTEPEKFTAALGTYHRVQLGLDLNRETDWYQGYFVDLNTWFGRDEDVLAEVGLTDLRKIDQRR